ncbi:protein SEMI-ROLLED LEAF 2 isoform X2 [Argentina anserina]|nr:protein SEMI-ROLLED LEAF 2 isoform X2 [Potentilla anserina]
MFNLDSMIPKLCQIAQEMREDGTATNVRAAGLQALSSMVWFMGEFSHISSEFDNVVSVVLENYEGFRKNSEKDSQGGDLEVFPSVEPMRRISSSKLIVGEKGEVNVSGEDMHNPAFWSRVCLYNIAKLAKEATTVRRVLDSLFRYFDDGDLWSPKHGVALSVLMDMQLIIEDSGQNRHFILSILIKHLDHKNVLKNPTMQLDIVDVVTSLARETKVQSSVAIIGALSDMMRHLRKSIHCSLDDSNLGAEVIEWNQKFRAAVDDCLVQLTHKVGDAGPVLDMMAVMLENMSNITVMARTLISAVYRTGQIVATIPNLSYQNKTFPEALFHQLLVAMVYADHETRVGAHRIFSVVLVPSSVCPRPLSATPHAPKKNPIGRTLSRTVSVFSSSAALFEKLKKEPSHSQENISYDSKDNAVFGEEAKTTNNSMLNRLKSKFSSRKREAASIELSGQEATVNNHHTVHRLKSTLSRAYSMKRQPSIIAADSTAPSIPQRESTMSLRLSSRQITLLLSSIWAQSIYPLNMPENYQAIAHTYSLVLLYARTKNTSHETLIRSFQLAFSLRSISLGEGLQPSRRRSLFTLATSMIIFSAKAYNIVGLAPSAKAAITNETVDPFLQLVDDSKLQATESDPDQPRKVFGSKEDNEDALRCLSAFSKADSQSKESFATMIVKTLAKSSDESSTMRHQLLNDFLPDETCPLGAPLCMETPVQIDQSGLPDKSAPNAVDPPIFIIDEESLRYASESQTEPDTKLASENLSLISVNELLDSVMETTHQVGRLSVSTATDMPYMEMAGQCEALQMGKQQKLSAFAVAQQRQESLIRFSTQDRNVVNEAPSSVVLGVPTSGNPFLDANVVPANQPVGNGPMLCATGLQHYPRFQLPASSPYDNFLKAAGC